METHEEYIVDQQDTSIVKHRKPVRALGFAQIDHIATMDPELSDGAYRTYVLYLMYAQQSQRAWPGRVRMAKERGKSEATITRHNQELERLGYITRENRHTENMTSITWLEDFNDNPRLVALAESYLEQRNKPGLKNEPTPGSKMRS